MTYSLVFLNILVLLFAIFTSVDYEKYGTYAIKNKKNQIYFYRCIRGFWISTLILYFIIGFKYSKENGSRENRADIIKINSEIADYSIAFKQKQDSFLSARSFPGFPKVEYYRAKMFAQLLQDSVFNFVRMDKYKINYINRIQQCSDSLLTIANSYSNEETQPYSQLNMYLYGVYKYAYQLKMEADKLTHYYKPKTVKILQFIEILISDIGAFFLFLAFLVLYNPEKNMKYLLIKSQWWIYIFVIGTSLAHVLLFTFWRSEDSYRIVKLFSGIFSALAMCLLVARFESTKMQSPLGLLIILYLYAIIQSVFGLFGIVVASFHYLTDDFAYTIALLGKTMLYLFILWIYSTKRIYFYFEDKLSDFYKTANRADYDIKSAD